MLLENGSLKYIKAGKQPLSLPYPVVVEKGTRISQSILLRMNGDLPTEPMREEPVRIIVSPDEKLIFPKVGISRSSRNIKLSPSEAAGQVRPLQG